MMPKTAIRHYAATGEVSVNGEAAPPLPQITGHVDGHGPARPQSRRPTRSSAARILSWPAASARGCRHGGIAIMGLRDRLRHDEAAGTHRYQMREKLISIGDDYWIEDESGQRAFKVDGKALRVRDTFILRDAAEQEAAKIQEHKLRLRDTMEIERPGGKATVHKAMIGIRDRFKIDVDGGPDMSAHGNIVDHEYEIERDGDTVATVSKKWFRVRDSYGVEIAPGQDDAMILAIAVCVDAMSHD
jgi:uncharacterized protein YxjI